MCRESRGPNTRIHTCAFTTSRPRTRTVLIPGQETLYMPVHHVEVRLCPIKEGPRNEPRQSQSQPSTRFCCPCPTGAVPSHFDHLGQFVFPELAEHPPSSVVSRRQVFRDHRVPVVAQRGRHRRSARTCAVAGPWAGTLRYAVPSHASPCLALVLRLPTRRTGPHRTATSVCDDSPRASPVAAQTTVISAVRAFTLLYFH